jgi:uncharacterized protein
MNARKCLLVFWCALSVESLAQQNVSVSMPEIPFPLSWENTPVSYEIKKHGLTIVAGEKTDMFRDPQATYNTDNAPKLLFQPDSNFVLTASVQHKFESKWDAGALVIKADEKTWIKFAFEKDYKENHRVVSVVTKDISDDCNSIATNSDKLYYKIAKAGKVVTLYCSEDGVDWFLVRHLQFESSNPVKVGFLAQSPTGKVCRVSFGDIRYEAKKIKDPYAGE